jgi:maltose alpha-D-glucosyltransferase/alpha-amylase
MSTDFFSSAFNASFRQWLGSRRWFGGKGRAIVGIEGEDFIPLRPDGSGLMLIQVEYTVGEPDSYLLPLMIVEGADAERLAANTPDAVIHRFDRAAGPLARTLFDALADRGFVRWLLEIVAGRQPLVAPADLPAELRELMSPSGSFSCWADSRLKAILASDAAALEPILGQGDQSNSCIPYGKKLILKLFRRLAPGVNPDLEIGRFLTQSAEFPNVPPMLGALEYRPPQGEPLTLGVLQQFVEGRSAWDFTLESLRGYFDRLATLPVEAWPRPQTAFQPDTQSLEPGRGAISAHSFWALAAQEPVATAEALTGDYLRSAALLGQRTAELHLALASNTDEPNFAPEPFTKKHQDELRWSMRDLTARTCELLRQRLPHLPAALGPAARAVEESQTALLARFDELGAGLIDAQRQRVHGDYHLGQVLYTGRDFAIIDFEGEPARSLEWRRSKRSPLVDVAGMLRSYHYAASQVFFKRRAASPNDPALESSLRGAADAWYAWSAAAFVRAYRITAGAGRFLPRAAADCDRLLTLFVLEKAVYELAYELNNRPDWVEVPLRGLLSSLGRTA